MLDIMLGRCTVHGPLTHGELEHGICWRCGEEPDLFSEDELSEVDPNADPSCAVVGQALSR